VTGGYTRIKAKYDLRKQFDSTATLLLNRSHHFHKLFLFAFQPYKRPLARAQGFGLEALIERVAVVLGLAPADLRGANKQRTSLRGRSSICALAMEYLGISGQTH
jgi:hypothetical protein